MHSTMVIIRRGMERGIRTLFREQQWMTALSALLGVFVLVQILMLVLIGLAGAQSMLHNKTDIRLTLNNEATDIEFQQFFSALGQEPSVKNALYIPKEKAYEQTRVSDPNLFYFLEQYSVQNPFNDTVDVRLNTLDNYAEFSIFIQQERWKNVVDPTSLSQITDQEKKVFELLQVIGAAKSVTVIILCIVAFVLVQLTTELVRRRVFARNDEILVERLAGALPLAITVPFITEAVLLLVIAIVLSTVVLIVLLALIPLLIPAMHNNGALHTLSAHIHPLLSTMLPIFILLELLTAPFIASLGAWLGVRPQRTKRRSLPTA